MADVLDLNNLTLEDNNFDCVPEGDYHFKVVSHEISYYTGDSDKIPANTQQIICHLEIPYKDTVVRVKHTQNVYSKVLFALRQFAECIGMCGEKGAFKFNVNEIDGKSGIAKILVQTSKNGNDFNKVDTFYAPSKAPTIIANEEEWKKYGTDGFLPISEEELPFK